MITQLALIALCVTTSHGLGVLANTLEKPSTDPNFAFLSTKGLLRDVNGNNTDKIISGFELDLKSFVYHGEVANMVDKKLARIVLEGMGTEFETGSSIQHLEAAGKPQAIIITKPTWTMLPEEIAALRKQCKENKSRLVWLNADPVISKGMYVP